MSFISAQGYDKLRRPSRRTFLDTHVQRTYSVSELVYGRRLVSRTKFSASCTLIDLGTKFERTWRICSRHSRKSEKHAMPSKALRQSSMNRSRLKVVLQTLRITATVKGLARESNQVSADGPRQFHHIHSSRAPALAALAKNGSANDLPIARQHLDSEDLRKHKRLH